MCFSSSVLKPVSAGIPVSSDIFQRCTVCTKQISMRCLFRLLRTCAPVNHAGGGAGADACCSLLCAQPAAEKLRALVVPVTAR